MKNLESILDQHKIPAGDRPAFRLLVDGGLILQTGFIGKLERGRHKKALDAILAELSKPVVARHPVLATDEKLVVLFRQTRKQRYFTELRKRYWEEISQFAARLNKESLVGEVFAAFRDYCESAQPLRPVRAWLHSAVRRVV